MTKIPHAVIIALALRFFSGGLFKGSGQRYVRFVNRASVAGLALGTAALIMVVSVMNGFDRTLQDRLLGVTPHILLSTDANVEGLTDIGIERVEGYLATEALLVSDFGGQLIELQGLPPESPQLDLHRQGLLQGFIGSTADRLSVLMGEPLARRFGLRPGDRVTVALVNIDRGRIEPRLLTLTLAGIYQLGAETDQMLVVTSLNALSKALGSPPLQRLHLEDPMQVDFAAEQARQQGVTVLNTWRLRYGSFFQAVWIEKLLMSFLLSMLVLLSLVSLASGMRIVIQEKLKTIWMLRSLGLSHRDCQLIFLQQGVLLAVTGVLSGTVLGVVCAYSLPTVMAAIESFTGFSIVAGSYFSALPVDVRVEDTGVVVMAAIGVSLFVLVRLISTMVSRDLHSVTAAHNQSSVRQ
jgi:lipoprotein-releasing system permease protein